MRQPAAQGHGPRGWRRLTLLTIVLLWVDGFALAVAGTLSARWELVAGGVALGVLGWAVWRLWCRQRRTLEEIRADRADVRAELQAMRTLLKQR